MRTSNKSTEVDETTVDIPQDGQLNYQTTQKENTMEQQKKPDLKAILSQIAINPGGIPQIKFESKSSVIKASPRPHKNSYFRVHPEYEQFFMMIPFGKEMKSKFFLIGPGIVLPAHLAEKVVSICCHLIVYPDGELQILERKCAMQGEPVNQYQQSLLNVVIAGRNSWVMRRWNENNFVYDYVVANDDYAPEPVWPKEDFMELLCKAYDGRVIDSYEHSAYLELAGIKASSGTDQLD